MRVTLLAVDKLRNKQLRALAKDYAGRIERHGKINTIEIKPSAAQAPDDKSAEESSSLIAKLKSSTVIIALDETGVQHSSMELADLMREDMLRGRSHWSLLIGGANGHSAELRAKAQRVWSLSALTLPHEMARVIVLEQIYRALSIIHNEPYHREG